MILHNSFSVLNAMVSFYISGCTRYSLRCICICFLIKHTGESTCNCNILKQLWFYSWDDIIRSQFLMQWSVFTFRHGHAIDAAFVFVFPIQNLTIFESLPFAFLVRRYHVMERDCNRVSLMRCLTSNPLWINRLLREARSIMYRRHNQNRMDSVHRACSARQKQPLERCQRLYNQCEQFKAVTCIINSNRFDTSMNNILCYSVSKCVNSVSGFYNSVFYRFRFAKFRFWPFEIFKFLFHFFQAVFLLWMIFVSTWFQFQHFNKTNSIQLQYWGE